MKATNFLKQRKVYTQHIALPVIKRVICGNGCSSLKCVPIKSETITESQQDVCRIPLCPLSPMD